MRFTDTQLPIRIQKCPPHPNTFLFFVYTPTSKFQMQFYPHQDKFISMAFCPQETLFSGIALSLFSENMEEYSEMIWKKGKSNSDKIWKVWKKNKLNSEKIWKIWKKSQLNSEMIWKICPKSFHYSTWVSSKFSISFHISTYFFSIFSSYLPLPRHFIFIITLFISIIIFLTKVCHHFIFQIFRIMKIKWWGRGR
jgi:hypothetical protein